MLTSVLSGNNLVGTIGDSIVATNGTRITLRARSTSSRVRFTTWRIVSSDPIGTITGSGATATLQLSSTPSRGLIIADLSGRKDTSFLWNANPQRVTSVQIVGIGNTVKIGTALRPRLEYTIDGTKARTVFANWASNTSAATYDAATGLFTFRTSGTAQIEAASGSMNTSLSTTVLAPIASGSLALASNRIVVGDSTTVAATFRNAAGQTLVCNNSTWTTSPSSGIVQLRRGVSQVAATLIGLSAGTATISASCDGSPAYAATLTVDPATVQTPPPTPQGGALALRVIRIDPSIPGNVLVSAGLPLAKSVLMPTAVSGVRLIAGSTEIARHASALQGRHSDGSVRSLLLQFSVPAASVNQTFQLALSGRTLPETPKGAISTRPTAVITYSDPSELIATGIVGRTRALIATPNSPAHYAKFDANFAAFEQTLWSSTKNVFQMNYYDRILSYFAFWARTGNPVYYARGMELADRFATAVSPDILNLNEVTAGLDGLYVYYLLTGDERSRSAILNAASWMESSRGSTAVFRNLQHPWVDNRTMARVLSTKLLAWMLGATSLPNNNGKTASYANLRGEMTTDVADIIAAQATDGAWRRFSSCNGSSNFMSGLLNGVLGMYYDEVVQDPQVMTAVTKSYDWLLSSQWLPQAKAFKYYEVNCPGHGGPTAAGDLNGLFLDGLAWLSVRSGNLKYRTAGEAVFEGTVQNAWLYVDKQFNQAYQSSFRWLGAL